jgi:hypothetical protein
MDKQGGLGWMFSGFFGLLLLVSLTLLGLNKPVTIVNIIIGILVYVGGALVAGLLGFFSVCL